MTDNTNGSGANWMDMYFDDESDDELEDEVWFSCYSCGYEGNDAVSFKGGVLICVDCGGILG